MDTVKDIKRITLTGGPCGGKSTSLSFVSQKFMDRGFLPLIVPEMPTLLMNGNLEPISGIFPARTFQRSVIDSMQHWEDVCMRAAQECSHQKPIIICDRGIPDAKAYMPAEMYADILGELGLGNEVDVRDGRYDGVCHLRTAAYGAEAFYTTANNSKRREGTLEEARQADDLTLAVWTGHPHLRVIGNDSDFSGKLSQLDQHLCRMLGIPVPLEIERKYLCAPVNIEILPSPVQAIDIEQVYTSSPDPTVEVRVRKRGQGGMFIYYRTEKRHIRAGVRVETEHLIAQREYESSLGLQLPSTRSIHKRRYCFVYKDQYFELDVIPLENGRLYLLEIELTEEAQMPILPDFLPIQTEVTGDRRFSNRALAESAANYR